LASYELELDLQGVGRHLSYYPSIYLEALKKATITSAALPLKPKCK